MRHTSTHSQRGFTLIDIITALAVVGILLAIIWPSYRRFAARQAIEQARAALQRNAHVLSRYYMRCNSYQPNPNAPYPCNTGEDVLHTPYDLRRYYIIRFAEGSPQPDRFILMAEPVEHLSENPPLKYDSISGLFVCPKNRECTGDF